MFYLLNINSHSKIANSIDKSTLTFQLFNFLAVIELNNEHPLLIFILKANISYNLVFFGTLNFEENNKKKPLKDAKDHVKIGYRSPITSLEIITQLTIIAIFTYSFNL